MYPACPSFRQLHLPLNSWQHFQVLDRKRAEAEFCRRRKRAIPTNQLPVEEIITIHQGPLKQSRQPPRRHSCQEMMMTLRDFKVENNWDPASVAAARQQQEQPHNGQRGGTINTHSRTCKSWIFRWEILHYGEWLASSWFQTSKWIWNSQKKKKLNVKKFNFPLNFSKFLNYPQNPAIYH